MDMFLSQKKHSHDSARLRGVYWITTFTDFHGITKSIKIIVYWITTFKDYKVMVYSIKTFKKSIKVMVYSIKTFIDSLKVYQY